MDIATLTILAFVVVIGIAMLVELLGHLVGVLAIVLAIANDLADIGVLLIMPDLGWLSDLVVFVLILLAYRNAGALVSLLDMVPSLGFLPFHTLSLLVSRRLKQGRKEEIIYVVKK